MRALERRQPTQHEVGEVAGHRLAQHVLLVALREQLALVEAEVAGELEALRGHRFLSAAIRYFFFAAWPALRPLPPEFQE